MKKDCGEKCKRKRDVAKLESPKQQKKNNQKRRKLQPVNNNDQKQLPTEIDRSGSNFAANDGVGFNRRSKHLNIFKVPVFTGKFAELDTCSSFSAPSVVANSIATYIPQEKNIDKNMSLYESRFQTSSSSDENRIVMTNGYIGSSGHRHTSGLNTIGNGPGPCIGGGSLTSLTANSLTTNDTNMTNTTGLDLPEMNGQYYLSSSGSSIAASGTAIINKNTGVNNQLSMNIVGNSSHQLHHNIHHHLHQQQHPHSHHQQHLQQHYNVARSLATLCNIGNTCYLNSVVYTLRFAPQFLHNLHHLLTDLNTVQQHIARGRVKSASLGRSKNDSGYGSGSGNRSGFIGQSSKEDNQRSWSSKDLTIVGGDYNSIIENSSNNSNSNNKLIIQKTSHQIVAEKLHELYQCLHRNELNESSESHHADTLLGAIQDVNPIFEGNQQQDAHEFLMCLLNSIRETSQTLIKSIMECPDLLTNG